MSDPERKGDAAPAANPAPANPAPANAGPANPGPANPGPTPAPALTEDAVREALRPVSDPEIGISIVDLGLVYGIEIDAEKRAVVLRMTLTSQMCPAGPEILAASEMAVRRLPGVEDVDIELVWQPPWDPRKHCSDEAKAMLGIWD